MQVCLCCAAFNSNLTFFIRKRKRNKNTENKKQKEKKNTHSRKLQKQLQNRIEKFPCVVFVAAAACCLLHSSAAAEAAAAASLVLSRFNTQRLLHLLRRWQRSSSSSKGRWNFSASVAVCRVLLCFAAAKCDQSFGESRERERARGCRCHFFVVVFVTNSRIYLFIYFVTQFEFRAVQKRKEKQPVRARPLNYPPRLCNLNKVCN